MAAKTGNRGDGGNTKIRFIMLEADGNASDLQQIAQAITSAVRPTFIQQVVAPPILPALPRNVPQQSIEADPDLASTIELVDEGVTTLTPSTKKSSGSTGKRRYRTPIILNDLDLTSGDMPLIQYVQEKNPDTHGKRYLVIAAWLKEYRQLDEIQDDHIYTCYRMLKQNTVCDIGSVFRGCKRQGWFSPGSKRGWYVVNHVGLNQVNDLNNAD